jgi:CAAX protease family protein
MPHPEEEPLESRAQLPQDDSPVEIVPVGQFPFGDVTVTAAQAPRPVFPPWSGWDVGVVLAFTVTAILLFSSIALGIAHLLTRKEHVPVAELASSTIVTIGSQLAAYPAVILFMVMLVRNKSRDGFWRSIHWNWPGAGAPAFLIGGVALAFVVEYASHWLPIPKSLPVDKYFSDMTGAYLMAVFGITLAPLLEELFFRGMLYPTMRRAAGVKLAVLFTAFTFALIHGAQLGYAWAPLLSIFVVGVALTLVRQRTESVAASFLMHCGYNLALFGSLWFATDHFRHLEKALE